MAPAMEISAHEDVYARLERVKSLLVTLAAMTAKSPEYRAVVDEIHAESVAYLASVDADRGVDRRHEPDRRQNCRDLRPRRINRRQFGQRR